MSSRNNDLSNITENAAKAISKIKSQKPILSTYLSIKNNNGNIYLNGELSATEKECIKALRAECTSLKQQIKVLQEELDSIRKSK